MEMMLKDSTMVNGNDEVNALKLTMRRLLLQREGDILLGVLKNGVS